MARLPRFFEPGFSYHAIQRGNNKAKIFLSHEDHLVFINYLREAKVKFPCHIYGYCLMPNHIHLIIEPLSKDNVSLFMKHATGLYAKYFNKRYDRTGVVYEGRFRAGLIQREEYFLNCLRYIENNPVRANLTRSAGNYPWSSYKFHTNIEPSSILDYDQTFLSLDQTLELCRKEYLSFFNSITADDSVNDFIRKRTNSNAIIGTDDFISTIKNYPQSY